jgi:hypothetical protein
MKHPPGFPVLLCAMLLFSVTAAYGQSAAELESLLETGEITCSQAAYLVLAAAEAPQANPEAAFAAAREKGWLPVKAESGDSITLSGLSLLMMKAFDLKGGLMYRFFPGGRYAYRTMTSRGFIEGRSYPTLKVSGEQFLQILGNILAERGNE